MDQYLQPERRRRAPGILRAMLGVLALTAAVVLPAELSAGASGPQAVAYAQCANGSPADPVETGCEGWINGILQASNSHYSEDQVTPQRLVAKFPAAGDHSITLRYQVLKGTTHAYDSLATWDHTQKGLDECQDLNPSDCVTNSDTTAALATIPADPNTVDPVGLGESNVTADHMLPAADRVLELYGAEFDADAFDPYIHTTSGSDQYATLTINIVTAAANQKVMLLFGGHLAVGPGARARGWGDGLGASDINGGPYHIKWEALDGASVGNRDNQIMGSAILRLKEVDVDTVASPTTATVNVATSLTDTASLLGAVSPTGTVTFSLHGPAVAGTPLVCDSLSRVAGPYTDTTFAQNAQSVWQASVTQSITLTAVGDYYWYASYSGDDNNAFGEESCGAALEKVTATKATPTGASKIILSDSATITGGSSPTGTLTFKLYGPLSAADASEPADACAVGRLLFTSQPVTIVGGAGTVDPTDNPAARVATYAGYYEWVVDYNGDASNNQTTLKACGTESALISY